MSIIYWRPDAKTRSISPESITGAKGRFTMTGNSTYGSIFLIAIPCCEGWRIATFKKLILPMSALSQP